MLFKAEFSIVAEHSLAVVLTLSVLKFLDISCWAIRLYKFCRVGNRCQLGQASIWQSFHFASCVAFNVSGAYTTPST